jgi:hypothetical protein
MDQKRSVLDLGDVALLRPGFVLRPTGGELATWERLPIVKIAGEGDPVRLFELEAFVDDKTPSN